ncbi:MAG: DUF4838 domain-containing protein [Kiritimatiellia bacterium]
MGKYLLPLLVGLCLVQAGPAADLVKNGKPLSEIIIAEKPARMTRLAASNLQEYVCKMTGAMLPVTNAPSENVPVKIYVGKSKYTDDLKLSTEGLAHGAFRMVSGPGWLALIGPDKDFVPLEPWTHDNKDRARALKDWDALNPGDYYGFPYSRFYDFYSPGLDAWDMDDGGTMNAVCEFLRGLGVRWYFPGELGEIVPKAASIALPAVDETVKPDFAMRRFMYWANNDENRLWNMRMGVNCGQELVGSIQTGHGQKWIHMRAEVKQAHPDWYAVYGGQRATNHSYSGAPCFSSEGLFKQHLKFVRMMFDVRREPALSLDPCDGIGRGGCECDLCKGKCTPERGWEGSMSDYVWEYVNRVAWELYKSHPDRKVRSGAYSAYLLPPIKIDKLSPNLGLLFCQARCKFNDRANRELFLNLRRAWLDKLPSGEIYIRDYYLHNCPRAGYGQPDIPIYYPRLIAEDLRSLKGVSMGDMIEVYLPGDSQKITWNPMAVMHLNIYATTRLWWDANQDLDAMLDEYYTLFYGPASREMKAFVEYSEKNWPLMSTKVEPIDKALELLAIARNAAGDTVYGRRIDLVVECLKPLKERREKLALYRKDAPLAFALECKGVDLKLNGRLDEAFWKEAPEYELKDIVTSNAPKFKTAFRVAWGDDKSIIFWIRCDEADMGNLNVSGKTSEMNIFENDRIELLLETQTHVYYQIAISAAGAIIDLDRKDSLNTLWSSETEAVVHKGDNFWSMEVKIPTADMIQGGLDPLKRVGGTRPTATAPWYFNVCRCRPRGAARESSAFSPTGKKRFNEPSKFGELIVK